MVLDYLNTMPLAATREHGEVTGIGDGLWVWFARDADETFATLEHGATAAERAAAYKPVLALICAANAPTRDLVHDHAGLERRVNAFARLLGRAGVIDPAMAQATSDTPLEFAGPGPRQPSPATGGCGSGS